MLLCFLEAEAFLQTFIKYGTEDYPEEQDVYIASWDRPPLQERRIVSS